MRTETCGKYPYPKNLSSYCSKPLEIFPEILYNKYIIDFGRSGTSSKLHISRERNVYYVKINFRKRYAEQGS